MYYDIDHYSGRSPTVGYNTDYNFEGWNLEYERQREFAEAKEEYENYLYEEYSDE